MSEQKAEYFRVLRETGISTKADASLVKLLLALQVYKAHYYNTWLVKEEYVEYEA